MSNLTETSKGVKNSKIGLQKIAGISAASTAVGMLISGMVEPTHVGGITNPMFDNGNDSVQSSKQMVNEIAYQAVHGDVKLQVHGNLKNDNSVITVTDSRNPNNFMLLKLTDPASKVKEYHNDKEDREVMDYYKTGSVGHHTHFSYAWQEKGNPVKAIKAVMSPDMPDSVYEGMLQTAQKIAKNNEANLLLQPCQQTYNHIAGLEIVETNHTISNTTNRYDHPIEGKERVLVMPITHNQLDAAQRKADPNVFDKYETSPALGDIMEKTLYQPDAAKIEQPKYDQNAPTVNVTFHNEKGDLSGLKM